ncbi:MAG: Nif3-like dinuclear metal center hexameric protein [Spirochaetales bacterium]
MTLQELDSYFRSILNLEAFEKVDSALNGLQVGRSSPSAPLKKVGFAVDACEESFKAASLWGAEVLCVHHGLYWGKVYPIVGIHLNRLRFLIEKNLALYAIHLPLDAHPVLGNNAQIAQHLQLTNLKPFGIYKGVAIGIQGEFADSIELSQIANLLNGPISTDLLVLPFGKPRVRTVAIVSGSAASCALEAVEADIDLFITGERSHTIYHTCLEGGLNVLFGGHYSTEIGGVKGLAERMSQDTGIETKFFDLPTGL